MNRWLQVVLASLLMLLSTAVTALANDPHYAIVIDAGSTRSRLVLFQYEIGNNKPIIKSIFAEATPKDHALASFADKPYAEGAGESLKIILDHARDYLHKHVSNPEKVKIYVLGTAGMRLRTLEQQHQIYRQVRHFITNNYPSFEIGKLETISGPMEGVYFWLSINYLLNNFANSQTNTVGIINMGGASFQVAFPLKESETVKDIGKDEKIILMFEGKSYTIFSRSFLGLGVNEALRATKLNKANNFNFFDYKARYLDVINQRKYQAIKTFIPTLRNHKFIFSTDAYDTGLLWGNRVFPEQHIVEKHIQSICNEPQNSKMPQVSFEFCAHSTYLETLLYDIFHFDDGHLQVKTKIAGETIGWQLGALLFALEGK